MTSPSSSTSSFSYGRYLAVCAIACACVVAAAMAASFVAIRHNLIQWHFGDLLDYQRAKIEAPERIDILLVGDSSLGNGVDARQWSQELGKRVVSVPLTGVYGLGGSLNMIKRAARRHRDISAIVIMQTADLMMRMPNRQGDLYTADRLSDIEDLRLLDLVPALANWDILSRTVARLVKAGAGIAADIRKADYVPQGAPLSAAGKPPPRPSGSIRAIKPENFIIARRIADECRRLDVPCVYVHGPVFEAFCQSSAAYLQEVLDRMEQAGLRVIRSTVCLPWAEVGDSVDHVHPARKEAHSAAILAAVRPFIAGQAVKASSRPPMR